MTPAQAFLSRLQTMYGEPDSDDPAAFLAEYARLLRNYTAKELDGAGDIVLRRNRYKTWPTVGECVNACEDVRDAASVGAPPPGIQDKYPEWSKEAVGKAYRLINSELGKQAAKDGWIMSLWDFCRKNRRLPREGELGRLIGTSREFDNAYRQVCAGGGGALGSALERLGASMLEKRSKLSAIANGETVGDE